mgnify:CR=1 FL=1
MFKATFAILLLGASALGATTLPIIAAQAGPESSPAIILGIAASCIGGLIVALKMLLTELRAQRRAHEVFVADLMDMLKSASAMKCPNAEKLERADAIIRMRGTAERLTAMDSD